MAGRRATVIAMRRGADESAVRCGGLGHHGADRGSGATQGCTFSAGLGVPRAWSLLPRESARGGQEPRSTVPRRITRALP